MTRDDDATRPMRNVNFTVISVASLALFWRPHDILVEMNWLMNDKRFIIEDGDDAT